MTNASAWDMGYDRRDRVINTNTGQGNDDPQSAEMAAADQIRKENGHDIDAAPWF